MAALTLATAGTRARQNTPCLVGLGLLGLGKERTRRYMQVCRVLNVTPRLRPQGVLTLESLIVGQFRFSFSVSARSSGGNRS